LVVVAQHSLPTPDAFPFLTAEQFAALLRAEIESLQADVLPTFTQFQVAPVRMEHRWQIDGREMADPVWVVARAGATILGYDEVEGEWGIGTARGGAVVPGGVVDDFGTFGDRLRWTLLRFPDPVAYIARSAASDGPPASLG
jgi:hypothetical protein